MTGKRFIALFSGINVGGNRVVKMAELRNLLEDLGYGDVATYVQSGNAVFSVNAGQAASHREAIESAFGKRWGFRSTVMVRDAVWLYRLMQANPFPDIADDPTKLHVFALGRQPTTLEIEALAERETYGDRWKISGDVLYLHTPNGIGRSKFAAGIGRWLKVPATARNWRTILALAEMIGRN